MKDEGAQTMSAPQHFESVHLLRGIAAMLVLIAHSFRPEYLPGLHWLYEDFIWFFGNWGVSIFFVISGFVLPLSLQKAYRTVEYPRFLLRRVIRIEPTYLVSMLVAIIWLWSATRYAPNATPWRLELGQIFAHLLYLIPFTDYKWVNEVYWTLAIEFQFYLLIGLLFCPLKKGVERGVWLGVMCCISFSLLALLPSFRIGLFHHSPFFALGILAWMRYRYRIKGSLTWIGVIMISGIGLASGLWWSNVCSGVLAFVLVLVWKPQRGKVRVLGSISYSLYVIHPPFVALGHVIGRNLLESGSPLVFLVPWVAMAISILAASVLYRLIELPTMRLSRKIRYNSGGSGSSDLV